MKTNPFYALSVSAMFLGCWLLSQALHLQAGQVGSLLVLIAVLQVYEGLLVGLGAFLVRTGRAPRDGVVVLALESVFLMDAPLLAAECVTASTRVGTRVALALLGLVVVKLAGVRLGTPGLLTRRAAWLLGMQAAFVLSVPVLAARLASERLLGPIALYGFWWATLAVPLAQGVLRDETRPDPPSRSHAIWTWVPAAMVLLHLWAVGYIHSIGLRPAFLAPLLLGLVAASRGGQVVRRTLLPGCAVLVSIGQGSSLGFHVFGADQLFLSPLRLTLLGVAAVWGYLAWRDRERWLVVLALGSGAAGLLGSCVSSLSSLLGRVLRFVGSRLPADSFGWGVLTVVAAFVFLAAGARRSLAREARRPPSGPGLRADDRPPRGRSRAALALSLTVFALSAMSVAFEGFPLGHPSQHGPAGLASVAAMAAFVMAARAYGQGAREADAAARHLSGLAMAASTVGFLLALAALSASGPCVSCSEARAIGEIRTRVASSRTPAPGGRAVPLAVETHGYRLSLRPGAAPGGFAWVAVPTAPGTSGVRGFCGDSSGILCFTADGRAPGVRPDGTCDLDTCGVLE